jgi:hypothetical protein
MDEAAGTDFTTLVSSTVKRAGEQGERQQIETFYEAGE